MEHKKQTGHVCRWMVFGITIVTIVVGCTIVIGLFEWRDRSRMESRNAETHLWRKNVYDLNMRVAKLSLLGETMENIDRHIIVRFLINTTIQCNKFNIQSFFSYNIKAKQYESIIKKQVKNQLSAVKKVTNKGNTYGKFKKKNSFLY